MAFGEEGGDHVLLGGRPAVDNISPTYLYYLALPKREQMRRDVLVDYRERVRN
jgi:hypothetical protein